MGACHLRGGVSTRRPDSRPRQPAIHLIDRSPPRPVPWGVLGNSVISITDLRVRYGDRFVLDRASVVLHEGERLGLVGRNGSGKSTLLRILAGETTPDSGDVSRQRDLILGFLSQEFTLDDSKTVSGNVLDGAAALRALIHQYESAPAHGNLADTLEQRINALDGWNIDQRVNEILSRLHAPEPDRPVKNLSGGEKRRVALARALVTRPECLILDEPTNHLDQEAIEWLGEFLARYPGAVLIATHDRYFLDRVCSGIVELDQGALQRFDGNYTDYLLTKAEQETALDRREQSRQGFLRRELEWVRRGPRARTTKSKSRLDRYFEIAGDNPPEKALDMELIIPIPTQMGNRAVELTEVGMDIGGRTLFRGVNLKIGPGTRLGLAGRNGVGKTTLLKLICGEMPPTHGTVRVGELTRVNYIDQTRARLDETKTVYEEAGQGSEVVQFGAERLSLRTYLRRFLFTEDRLQTLVRHLSGGERSRLILARILKQGGNLLILDEPTNDLDLPTLRILEEALIAFTGAILVVSHDRYFLNRICSTMLVFEGDGKVAISEGNYDYYLEKKARDASAAASPPSSPAPKAAAAARSTLRKLKFKEEQELAGMEAAILKVEQEIERIEALFASPGFFKLRSERSKLEAELAEARSRAVTLFARWEELEAIKGAVR